MGSQSPNGAAAKMYGITKPISIAGPTKPDLYRNAELEKVIGNCLYIFFQLLIIDLL